VKWTEISPATRNTVRKPAETAALTTSARRIVARCVPGSWPCSPRKYMRYVGRRMNPHGFTVATNPRRNDNPT
jgi:hypothetical protein